MDPQALAPQGQVLLHNSFWWVFGNSDMPRLCQWVSNRNRDLWEVNSSPRGQNGRHFTDNIFRCIFVNAKICILIEISLKFVVNSLIDNNPALV